MAETNVEGLTWSEWAYAAGVEEPPLRHVGSGTASHDARGYAWLYPTERRAWRAGEDPTDWRAERQKERRA